MKKKTTLTKMHIAPSTVRYNAVAARDSNEVGQILAGTLSLNFSVTMASMSVIKESANGKKAIPLLASTN